MWMEVGRVTCGVIVGVCVSMASLDWEGTGPEGSICPGGYRSWALPGYWKQDEATPVVESCLPPAQERCAGWDTVSVSDVGVGLVFF